MENSTVTISVQMLNKILEYLGTRPYSEVAEIIQGTVSDANMYARMAQAEAEAGKQKVESDLQSDPQHEIEEITEKEDK